MVVGGVGFLGGIVIATVGVLGGGAIGGIVGIFGATVAIVGGVVEVILGAAVAVGVVCIIESNNYCTCRCTCTCTCILCLQLKFQTI